MLKVNGLLFGNEYFGNNEANYKDIKVSDADNKIELYFEDNRDITNLTMAVIELSQRYPAKKNHLWMYYLPYGAMDRKIEDQLFSLKLFAHLINSMRFETVHIMDAHNKEVVDQLFHNVIHMDINEYVGWAISRFNPDILYFPDKGAMKKYPGILDTKGLPIIHGNKVRDTANKGALVSYETITGGVDVAGKRVLIVDDICRKGGTFTWAASELVKLGVGSIGLYVSHCEAGILEGSVLNEDSPISAVYTTDSEPEFWKVLLHLIEEAKADSNGAAKVEQLTTKGDKLHVYYI